MIHKWFGPQVLTTLDDGPHQNVTLTFIKPNDGFVYFLGEKKKRKKKRKHNYEIEMNTYET